MPRSHPNELNASFLGEVVLHYEHGSRLSQTLTENHGWVGHSQENLAWTASGLNVWLGRVCVL